MKKILVTLGAWLALTCMALAQMVPGGSAPMQPVGSFVPKPNLTISKSLCLFGDSMMANADSGNGSNPFFQSVVSGSPGTWVSILSGYRVYRPPNTLNFGVTGDTTGNMLARINTVLAAGCDVIVMEGGTNDAAGSIACATTVANYKTLWNTLLASGSTVIFSTIIPRTGGLAFTATQVKQALCDNQYARNYAEQNGTGRGFYLVDLDPIMTDLTQATWTAKTGYISSDNVHPSTLGSYNWGNAVAAVINGLYPNWLTPSETNSDVYDGTNNPTGNLLPTTVPAGSGGSASNGCTGTGATSVSVNGNNALAGATCVASVVSLSDGRGAQQIVLSGTYTPAANEIADTIVQVVTPANVVTNDTIQGEAYINIGANTNVAAVDVFLQDAEGATTFRSQGSNPSGGGVAALPSGGFSGVVRTPTRTVTQSPSSIFLIVRIYLVSTGSAGSTIAGTIQVTSLSVRKVLYP